MTGDFLNQKESMSKKTTFNDLLNKIDLLLPENKVIPPVSKNREVFKKIVATSEMLKVGIINPENRIILDEPFEVNIKSPNLYRSSWYVKHPSVVSSYINVKPEGIMTIMSEKAIQNEILIIRRGATFTTGVITVDGKAIYYDQYL